MSESAASERALPFESASELRQTHTHLLEQLDQELARDSSPAGEAAAFARLQAQIREFLGRGAATGVYLEDVKERTACTVLLDYWVSSLTQAGIRLGATRLARFDDQQLPNLEDKQCPYVGLEAFRSRDYFFGREADTRTLVAQVREAPLVVVLGASGSGKSSLVMGGVLPALEQEATPPGLRVAPTFVPANAVLDHLAQAALQVTGGTGDVSVPMVKLRQDPGYLAELLGGAAAPPTVMTIDQFEEVFTLSTPTDRDALVANLARLLETGRGHRVILTMREEFRSRMVELHALGPYLDKAWYSMRPMYYDELRAAVEKPAAMVNLQFQAGIVDDLVKKVLGQPAALPLLQFTLRALWSERDRNRITWEVYNRVGDPLNALRSSADQFHDGLAPQTQDEVKRVLLELVRVDEMLEAYRQPVPKGRLLQAGKANTEEVLQLLANEDYIRITPGSEGNDAVVEVKHESLVRNWPRYVSWIDEKRLERRQRLALTQAADRWMQRGRPEEGLLTGWQLEESKRHPDLSALECEFVEASSEHVDRARRDRERALVRSRNRSRAALAIVITIATAIAGATVYFWMKAGELDLKAQGLEIVSNHLKEETEQQKKARVALEKSFAKLQADYNDLFAKQVGQAVAPESRLSSSQPVTIYLHISDDNQRRSAEEIARQLRENNIKVPGIRRVDPVAQSDVRYFRPEDRLGALEIVRLLNQYLGVDARMTPKLVKGFEAQVPGRQYEIWFAPDALGNPLDNPAYRQRPAS